MKYQSLFIDFDDTLYDTHGNADIALHEVFEQFQLNRYFPDPPVFYDTYWWANIDLWSRYAKGEITRDFLIVERFRRPLSLGIGLDVTEQMCLEINDQFLDLCSSKPGVIDGAHELMEYLHSRGYRIHMTSNGFHEVQYKKLDACSLRPYFDTIILSEDAGANKPSQQFFDYALRTSQSERETTLMIGDNLQTDIKGALNAGIDAMLFNRWQESVTDCHPSPTFVVDKLSDIMHIL